MLFQYETIEAMNTIFKNPKKKPYFDEQGNWWLPQGNILFPGQTSPKLSPGAWQMLLLLESKADAKYFQSMVGSRTTQWRKRRELKEKGYL